MTQDILEQVYGMEDQELQKVEVEDGCVVMYIKTKDEYLRCSKCQSPNVIKKGVIERGFRTLPIGFTPVFLRASIQRLECKDCGYLGQEALTYVDKKKASPMDFDDMF